jgi:hypothetical protein
MNSTAASTAPRRRRPSAGFVAVCANYLLAAAFLGWGLTTPDLDRVWTLHHELKIGERGMPRGEDRAVMTRALRQHAELANALLAEGEIGLISANDDGWITTPDATILRTPRAQARLLRLDVETPRDLLPFKVEVEGDGWDRHLEIKAQQSYTVALPAPSANAELITVRLKGRELRADPSVLGVHIAFDAGRAP